MSRAPKKRDNTSIELGSVSPRSYPGRGTTKPVAQITQIQDEKLSTPLDVLELRLADVQKKLEHARRVDDFTKQNFLSTLPTDIESAPLQSKLQARQMVINFLLQEERWYQEAIKRINRHAK